MTCQKVPDQRESDIAFPILLFSRRSTEVRGTNPCMFLEFRREMLRMAEANRQSDFCQRILLADKETLGSLDAPADYVLMRSIAGAFGERSNEMSGAQSDQRSHFRQSDRPSEVFLDEFGDSFKTTLGETASIGRRRFGAAHPLQKGKCLDCPSLCHHRIDVVMMRLAA